MSIDRHEQVPATEFCQIFEHQVLSTPQAPALFYKGAQLTYEQLNQHANQLAHFFR